MHTSTDFAAFVVGQLIGLCIGTFVIKAVLWARKGDK